VARGNLPPFVTPPLAKLLPGSDVGNDRSVIAHPSAPIGMNVVPIVHGRGQSENLGGTSKSLNRSSGILCQLLQTDLLTKPRVGSCIVHCESRFDS
jgi:hypothetical protein